MKKIAFCTFVLSLVVVGSLTLKVPHAAAAPPPEESAISQEDAVLLKKTLDNLGSVLKEIEMRLPLIAADQLRSRTIAVTLRAIDGKLAAIDSTLTGLTLAKSGVKPPQIQVATLFEEGKKAKITVTEGARPPTGGLIPQEGEAEDLQLATVESTFNPRNLLISLLAVLGIGALVFFMPIGGKKEKASPEYVRSHGSEETSV